MSSPLHTTTILLLEKYALRPQKSLGQHFLIDSSAATRLVHSARLQPSDTVVEVGAGLGTLTKLLAQNVQRVIAVEKSSQLIPVLTTELASFPNTEIVEGDILTFNPEQYNLSSYVLVGAPPYYLTARLFRTFLQNTKQPPKSMSLLIQKEVAEKIAQQPPRSSLMSISVQLYGTPEVCGSVPPSSFLPQPSVASEIIALSDITKPSINEDVFFSVVRAGFSSPRKQLTTALAHSLNIKKSTIQSLLLACSIDPTRRAETLTIQKWMALTRAFIAQHPSIARECE